VRLNWSAFSSSLREVGKRRRLSSRRSGWRRATRKSTWKIITWLPFLYSSERRLSSARSFSLAVNACAFWLVSS
jgi:hypothetical protein